VTNGFDEFDFTVKNPYGIQSTTSSGYYETGDADVTEINADKEDALDVVSISFVTESGSGYRSWQSSGPKYDLRVYSGTNMVFEVPEGYVISQIGLVGSEVHGTFEPEEKGTHQDITGIPAESQLATHWHAGADQKLNKVTLKITDWKDSNNKTKTGSFIDKIYVLYEANNSNLKPAELSFNNTYAGVYYNEPAKLPAVSNPNKLPVTYSIQNLDESLYTIVPSKDGKTIDVTINVEPASYGELTAYTLEAKTAENDTFRSGYAIMRLNVYEHLNVTANMMGQELENNNDVIIITSDDEDDMIQFKFDVPEGAKMFYQTRLPDDSVFEMPQLFAASDDDEFVCEEGFRAYDDEKGVWWMPNFGAKLEFYIASYGYKSPKRTLYLNAQDPLMIAFGGTETDLNGTFTYVDHSVNDKSKHTFKLDDVTNISYLLNEGVYPPFLLIDLAIEPMFTPVADEDIPEYDKENDAMKYEDAEAWFDEDSYKLMIKAKHAGKYRLTATLNGFTAKPGQKAVAEIEVTPNLDEVYMHGIDIKDAGNGNFTLNIDKENNPKGRVEYIGTGHPIYGEGNGLWYQLHYDNAALFATDKPQFAATPDEDKWVKADGAFNLVNEAGQAPSDIHLKLTTNGVTKVKSFPIADIETAVAAIEGDNNGEPVYIDMNGMVVKEPSNGIYIRVVNGRADKVMIVE
ncbi:MAG: hypothetical protein K2I91_01825, partial [Muribaculaceae bacterium]|nr:hypothetical protein [Muribaculaceae bacterium]